MQLSGVLAELDRLAPLASAEAWDNVGLMVGDLGSEISSVLVSLDPSLAAIAWARDQAIDLLLTHHPLILHPIRNVRLDEGVGRKIGQLVRAGIALVSLHTNLDAASGGVADTLAERVGLEAIEACGMLRAGRVAAGGALAPWVRSLGFGEARIVDAGRDVKYVAVCPGSGMDAWREALSRGCDTFVTGDVRYHAALDAREAGLNVVDLGHYATEALVCRPLVGTLRGVLAGVDVRVFEGQDVFQSIKDKE